MSMESMKPEKRPAEGRLGKNEAYYKGVRMDKDDPLYTADPNNVTLKDAISKRYELVLSGPDAIPERWARSVENMLLERLKSSNGSIKVSDGSGRAAELSKGAQEGLKGIRKAFEGPEALAPEKRLEAIREALFGFLDDPENVRSQERMYEYLNASFDTRISKKAESSQS